MFKEQFMKWVQYVGEFEARARLARRGLGMSTIDQMVGGTYQHEPRGTNRIAITEEMSKDGFTLKDEGAA